MGNKTQRDGCYQLLHGDAIFLARIEFVSKIVFGTGKKIETKRTFEFLTGLNYKLDDVHGGILSNRHLPSIRVVFVEV